MQAKDWRKLPKQIIILGKMFYLGSCIISGFQRFTCMVKIVDDWFYYDGKAQPLFVSLDRNELLIDEKLESKQLIYAYYFQLL
jgi:hypothetical protein